MTITLNGDPFEVAAPLTIAELLLQLHIDSRRVAVEHNLVVLKRAAYRHDPAVRGRSGGDRQLRRRRLERFPHWCSCRPSGRPRSGEPEGSRLHPTNVETALERPCMTASARSRAEVPADHQREFASIRRRRDFRTLGPQLDEDTAFILGKQD